MSRYSQEVVRTPLQLFMGSSNSIDHELIHVVQFVEGYDMYDPSTEDESAMLEIAEEHLSETTIPKLWRSSIRTEKQG